MIHIQRNPVVPAAFKTTPIKNDISKYKRFFKRSVKSRSQEGFKEAINGDTQETLEAVAKQFKKKCAACEQSLTIHNIICDSWRPRNNAKGFNEEFAQDHYWWLAYDWNNKYALCANCNKFKGTWFPVEGKRSPLNTLYATIIKREKALLVDPCHDYPELHFVVDKDGKLLNLTKKGEVTIELLKLNRKELQVARKSAINAVSNLLMTVEKLWPRTGTGTLSVSTETTNLKKIQEIFEKVVAWLGNHPEDDFIMVRRQVLITWLVLKQRQMHMGILAIFLRLIMPGISIFRWIILRVLGSRQFLLIEEDSQVFYQVYHG